MTGVLDARMDHSSEIAEADAKSRSAGFPARRKIVVGVSKDGSARSALHWAFGAAAANEALLVVVTAYLAPRAVVTIDGFIFIDPSASSEAARSAQERIVHAELRRHASTIVPERVVAPGSPIDVLLAVASAADLLVVGQRRGWVSRMFTGSVSRGCANAAGCPVVIVRNRTSQAEHGGNGLIVPAAPTGGRRRDARHRGCDQPRVVEGGGHHHGHWRA